MSAVLVTGGGGFIGSNLVRGLLERGDKVRVLDNFSTGSRQNLDGLDIEVVEGELRSYERVHNAIKGAEVVFHLGALGSVPRSVQDPLTSSAVNVEGTLNVLLAARDEGVRRVVFSSSTSVYGSSRQLPTTEDTPPDPISPLVSKFLTFIGSFRRRASPKSVRESSRCLKAITMALMTLRISLKAKNLSRRTASRFSSWPTVRCATTKEF